MNRILIRTRSGVFTGELTRNSISDTIWLSLPLKSTINMLGSMIFFECPVDCIIEGEKTKNLEKGDIAYWEEANALCLFFGPTPLSKDDGKPVSPYPVIKIGKLIGEIDAFEDSGDRQQIKIEQTFD